MRVIDMLTAATAHLKERGFENARLEVERLLGEVLGLSRIDLYLSFERPVTDKERSRFRALYRRRLKHEPLQYILGFTGFHYITVKSDRRAFVPRPETELLTQAAIDELLHRNDPVFIDLGTGSGVIALSILNAIPEARGVAVDIDENALALARENARLLEVADRIVFVRGDMTVPLTRYGLFDVVVSNPPYITRSEIDRLEPEVRDHDPRVALDGGADGLAYFNPIVGYAHLILKPGGVLLMECGAGQADKILQRIHGSDRYSEEATIRDLSGRDRIVRARTRQKQRTT
ncbi:peptide chain release factor N(5)-glutamine methyltransferase [Candidatus Latescibacterota bacterium]